MAEIPGLDALLEALNAGETIEGGSAHHGAMHAASQEALRIAAELNGHDNTPAEVRALMSELTVQSDAACQHSEARLLDLRSSNMSLAFVLQYNNY